MLRRDGNVIGNPIPTNTSSATGVFRIAAGQQKNILTKDLTGTATDYELLLNIDIILMIILISILCIK